jgi:hypothetical protein
MAMPMVVCDVESVRLVSAAGKFLFRFPSSPHVDRVAGD